MQTMAAMHQFKHLHWECRSTVTDGGGLYQHPLFSGGESPDTLCAQSPEKGGESERTTRRVDAASTASPRSNDNDDELVVLSLRGDSNAFGELVRRYYDWCFKRAIVIMRNRSDAEDEVQNAFWKAFQHLVQYRGDGSFGAWLGRIVENQCLMRIRLDRKSRYVYLSEPKDSNVKLELVGALTNPEDELGEAQVSKLLQREISRIPPLLRSVIVLRDVEQLPMPEVALRLGLTLPAAKSRLIRARTELRQRVAKHCGRKGHAILTERSRYRRSAYCGAA